MLLNGNSFFSDEELALIGIKKYGANVKISRKASIYGPNNILLGSNIRIDDFTVLSAPEDHNIVIGSHVHISCFCGLYGGAGIEMEDFSGLSSHVSIYSESDDYTGNSLTNPTIPIEYKKNIKKGKVLIGRHCIIGVGSSIMPKSVIEEGVAVGAYSLVIGKLKGWGIYKGIPAKFFRERSKKLLGIEKRYLEECGKEYVDEQ